MMKRYPGILANSIIKECSFIPRRTSGWRIQIRILLENYLYKMYQQITIKHVPMRKKLWLGGNGKDANLKLKNSQPGTFENTQNRVIYETLHANYNAG
jgi:hypothetical protein